MASTVRARAAVTKDVCEAAFPPERYGRHLAEVEVTVQEVVERVFRDADGLIRSGVYGRTMRPLRAREATDRVFGIGGYAENHAMLNRYKPVYMNYENAGQASGKYIRAMLRKYAVTDDRVALDRTKRTVDAIRLVWDNVARTNPYGRGWLPKPFGGARDVSEMFECSPDQYTDVTLGLECYYRDAADARERRVIERMVVSFADWWLAHDYTTTYQGTCCWWKRTNFPHAVGFFLYLNALAHAFRPRPKYVDAFDLWLTLRRGLFNCARVGLNASGLAIECMERLIELRPDRKVLWRRAAKANTEHMIGLVHRRNNVPRLKGTFNFNGFAAHHLCAADRLFPSAGHRRRIRSLISAYRRRANFYHIRRGVPVARLAPVLAGNDYRDMFWAEGHVCWLNAYWTLQGL